MNSKAIRYLSLLLVLLMGGSFLSGVITQAQTSGTAGGVTISVSSNWVSYGQVVLVSVYDPNVPQSAVGAKYVEGNITISNGTVTLPLNSTEFENLSSVYYLQNGGHYFWFFITMTPVMSTPTVTVTPYNVTVTKKLTINGSTSNVMLVNNNLVASMGTKNVLHFTIPSSFPDNLISIYGMTVKGGGYVNVTSLYYFSTSKTITIQYSTGASVTINNYEANSGNYQVTAISSQSTVPLNSTWTVLVNDQIMQADPLVGGNGGYTVYVMNNYPGVYSPIIQNVSYVAIKNGVYVNTTIFSDNPISNALSMFGYGNVYNGNYTMYTSSVVTNSTYATLTPGGKTPSYSPSKVEPYQYYNLTIRDRYFTTSTPITIYFSDWLANNASVSVTGTIKETLPQPLKLSVLKGENLTVDAFDNISNFSVNEAIPVKVSLLGQNGETFSSKVINLSETYAGSGVFSMPAVLEIGMNYSIGPNSAGTEIVITLPPYDFSNTSILVTATNDIGASFYYLGQNKPVNVSTPGQIVVGQPSLEPVPQVTVLPNVSTGVELAYYEPNLAFGTPTTLNVQPVATKTYDDIVYNGVTIALANITYVLPNGTSNTVPLSNAGINILSSANGNGTFFINLPRTTIVTEVLKLGYIPSGTQLTFKIYDEFAAQTLTVTYKFQTIAPVITIETPTSTSFSSGEVAYLPPLPYNVLPEKHYILINVTDQLYANSIPSTALQATLNVIVENASGKAIKGTSPILVTLTETGPGTGLFTGQIYYTVVKNSNGYYLDINGISVTNLENVINGFLVFNYTSPSSNQQVNATASLKTSTYTLTVNQTSANPGAYVKVTVNSPGLVEGANMRYTGYLTAYVQYVPWNGYSSTLTPSVAPISLSEDGAGSPLFVGTVVLGNSSVVTLNNLTSIINMAGYTVAPGSVVLVNSNASIGPTSTSSSITPYYQQQTISINVPSLTVSILNPSPASPFAKLEIELNSTLFNLYSHPSPGNYTSISGSGAELLLENIISTVTTQQSQQLITGTALISSSDTSFYYNNSIWVISVPMTLWSGTPGSYGVPINVNLTDLLQVTHNVYTVHTVEVPNVSTGTVSIVSAYAVPSVSGQVATLQINGLVKPIISVYFNNQNITQSAAGAVPYPNTTAGELVNITVYAPDAVDNPNVPGSGSTFNVTILNTANGETTTLVLSQETKIVSGVPIGTPYYTGQLKVVEPDVFTPGVSGEISASPGLVNKVLVNMNVVEGTYFNYNGLKQQLTMKSSTYFYVGVIKVSVLVSHFTLTYNGTPTTSMMVGKTYSILFNVTDNGNVNETVYGTLEVLLNGTPVQPEVIAVVTLAPGQSTQVGALFTPTMPGNYTIVFIPFQNNLLSIPYNQGLTEVVSAS
ncbi:hypothetical protein GWK48_02675 [Metallosphaera tengchongensis]|uniref:S-layer protein n=1 Tax=Metallosphaera tengchongensis TaxID=1532350 RepID=A0A6N0NRV4_9CREN|nr:S-layer protein SlaA [Metallosphaera tengchongensis]QKQ99441.1 hypothetical protein GWK48_02675 [Metallosphaera tengchongensis]